MNDEADSPEFGSLSLGQMQAHPSGSTAQHPLTLPDDDEGKTPKIIKCIFQHKTDSKSAQTKTMEGLPTPQLFPVKLYQR